MSSEKKVFSTALATIAASGAVTVDSTAQAADVSLAESSANPLSVTVVGGLVLSDFSKKNIFEERLNYADSKIGVSTDKDVGGFGSISLGRKFDAGSEYDWRVTSSITQFMNNNRDSSTSYLTYTYFATAKDSAGWQHFDLEVGRNLSGEMFDARISGGLRLSHIDVGASGSYGAGVYGYSSEIGSNSDVKFAGGGPMGKIEGRVGGMVGVEFAGSIAALYGQQKTSAGFHYGYSYWGVDFPLFGADGSDTDWKWLTDVEVSAGLSVKPSESVNLSAGYRYERIDKLDNTFDQSDISAHGPYLKVEMKF